MKILDTEKDKLPTGEVDEFVGSLYGEIFQFGSSVVGMSYIGDFIDNECSGMTDTITQQSRSRNVRTTYNPKKPAQELRVVYGAVLDESVRLICDGAEHRDEFTAEKIRGLFKGTTIERYMSNDDGPYEKYITLFSNDIAPKTINFLYDIYSSSEKITNSIVSFLDHTDEEFGPRRKLKNWESFFQLTEDGIEEEDGGVVNMLSAVAQHDIFEGHGHSSGVLYELFDDTVDECFGELFGEYVESMRDSDDGYSAEAKKFNKILKLLEMIDVDRSQVANLLLSLGVDSEDVPDDLIAAMKELKLGVKEYGKARISSVLNSPLVKGRTIERPKSQTDLEAERAKRAPKSKKTGGGRTTPKKGNTLRTLDSKANRNGADTIIFGGVEYSRSAIEGLALKEEKEMKENEPFLHMAFRLSHSPVGVLGTKKTRRTKLVNGHAVRTFNPEITFKGESVTDLGFERGHIRILYTFNPDRREIVVLKTFTDHADYEKYIRSQLM